MDTNNKWEQVKGFFRKIGRRNLIIAGAVVAVSYTHLTLPTMCQV